MVKTAKPKASGPVQVGEQKYHISPPNMGVASFNLIGTSPLMVSSFTQKAIDKMRAVHEAGMQARGKKVREKRNFDDDYEQAHHRSQQGWAGFPAGAFRTAMVDACRLVGFQMTKAKLAVFVESDGLDAVTSVPLVRIIGSPKMSVKPERNDDGSMDLRARPVWETWSINPLRVKFDMDQFAVEDVFNLLLRAGMQVGIGEGRPNSRNSTGIGYGLFDINPDFKLHVIKSGKR